MKTLGSFLEEEALRATSLLRSHGIQVECKISDHHSFIPETEFSEPYNYDLIIDDVQFLKATELIKVMFQLDLPIHKRWRCYKCDHDLSGETICRQCGTINSSNGIVLYWRHPVIYYLLSNGFLSEEQCQLYNEIKTYEHDKPLMAPGQNKLILSVVIPIYIILIIVSIVLIKCQVPAHR
jgi:hypothetical protein